MTGDHLILPLQQLILLGELLRLYLQFLRLPVHFLLQHVLLPVDGFGIPSHKPVDNLGEEEQDKQTEPPPFVQDRLDIQGLFILGQDISVLVDRADLNLVFPSRNVSEFEMGIVFKDRGPVFLQRPDPALIGDIRPLGVGQIREFEREIRVDFILVDRVGIGETVELIL